MDRNSVSVLLGALFVVLFALYVGVTSMPAIRASLEQDAAVPPPEVRVLPVPEEPVEVAVSEEPVPEPLPECMPPYIEDGDGCCIDNDYDYVCDPDVSLTDISVNCARCDDHNPCTYEVCVEDRCIVTCQAGSACDDNDPYTFHDNCVALNSADCVCRGDPVGCVTDSECDDDNPCSEDRCVSNVCNHICRVGIACDDGMTRTEDDRCLRRRGSCICEGR